MFGMKKATKELIVLAKEGERGRGRERGRKGGRETMEGRLQEEGEEFKGRKGREGGRYVYLVLWCMAETYKAFIFSMKIMYDSFH